MKTTILISILLMCAQAAFAPRWKHLTIQKDLPINPYELVWTGVCQVESKNDPLAYNPKEQAYGLGQIRPIRLVDFNYHTGKNYSRRDMFDPIKNREVFMYYIHQYGINNIDLAIRRWNGSGFQTYTYLEKVRKAIKLTRS
jgi:hypothetical protein